jgi:hypothetical protein
VSELLTTAAKTERRGSGGAQGQGPPVVPPHQAAATCRGAADGVAADAALGANQDGGGVFQAAAPDAATPVCRGGLSRRPAQLNAMVMQ